MTTNIPVALSIAGSDSSGGAGVQIDMAAIRDVGAFPMCVITAVTAQNSRGVNDLLPVDCDLIRAQLESLLDDFQIQSIKTGMLPTPESVETVASVLEKHENIRLVVDPVLVATSGTPLTLTNTIDALRRYLIPLASLVTPNIPEAQILAGISFDDFPDPGSMARKLFEKLKIPTLLTGGHDHRDPVEDCLATSEDVEHFYSTRREGSYHGTGCSLSACITAYLARGLEVGKAVRSARYHLLKAMDRAFVPGQASMSYLVF